MRKITLDLIIKQLKNFWPVSEDEEDRINSNFDVILERYHKIALATSNKYFKSPDRSPLYSAYHSDQYAMILYLLGNELFQINQHLAEKLYYLNKVMHSIDLYPAVELPEIFCLFHPVGTVIGRANFSNYFTISQNCTVGNNKGIYPTIGNYVSLMANSMVLGNSKIGNNCIISAGSIVKDQNIPANSVVFGISPNITVKPNNLKNQYWVNE